MRLDETTTALVCGGASGMGESTARALRQLGVKVGILDKDQMRGQAIATEIGASFAEVDVGCETSVHNAFERIREQLGQERILVHTPAIGTFMPVVWRDSESGEIKRHALDQFEKILSVNVAGPLRTVSLSAAGMMTLPPDDTGERGTVILTSSIVSIDQPQSLSAYAASRAALDALTLSWARDLGPEAIRVNTILPGTFRTPITAGMTDEYRAKLVSTIPFPKRPGEAPEYASLALELMRNPYLNGTIIRLDGGARIGLT